MDQEPVFMFARKSFTKLLQGPSGSRMRREIAVHNPPRPWSGARDLKRRPLAPPPIPAMPDQWGEQKPEKVSLSLD